MCCWWLILFIRLFLNLADKRWVYIHMYNMHVCVCGESTLYSEHAKWVY